MFPVQHLREFISARLTAAAEEIFSEFEKTIEDEIDRHRRLLDIRWKPQIKFHTAAVRAEEDQEEVLTGQGGEQLALQDEADMVVQSQSESEEVLEITNIQTEEETDHQPKSLNTILMPLLRLHRIDIPQQHICKEEEEEEKEEEEEDLTDQERNCTEPEPPQIKEEPGEQSTNQEGDQLVLKQESETFLVTSNDDDSDGPIRKQLLSPSPLLAEHRVQEADREVFSASHSTRTRHSYHKGKSSASESNSKKDQSRKPLMYDVCNVCGNIFTHTGKKPFSCESCVAGSADGNSNIHAQKKPHSCQICSKSFSHKRTLKNHMRAHTGENIHSCETCGKSFTIKTNLTVHMRTHTGEKPYTCKMCSKTFRQSHHLKTHIYSHTRDCVHLCKTCGKGFPHRTKLRVHMRKHTGEKPYSHGICWKSFT